MYNPPISDERGGSIYKARLSTAEIEAIVTAHRGLSEEDKQTHIFIQRTDDDSEIEAILGMLAGESFESMKPESGSAALEQSGVAAAKVDGLASPRRKRHSRPDA